MRAARSKRHATQPIPARPAAAALPNQTTSAIRAEDGSAQDHGTFQRAAETETRPTRSVLTRLTRCSIQTPRRAANPSETRRGSVDKRDHVGHKSRGWVSARPWHISRCRRDGNTVDTKCPEETYALLDPNATPRSQSQSAIRVEDGSAQDHGTFQRALE